MIPGKTEGWGDSKSKNIDYNISNIEPKRNMAKLKQIEFLLKHNLPEALL